MILHIALPFVFFPPMRRCLPLLAIVVATVMTSVALVATRQSATTVNLTPSPSSQPRKCMSDCTSHELMCVDWDGQMCRQVNAHGCCEQSDGDTPTNGKQCDVGCCTDRYSECVAWCVVWTGVANESATRPQTRFDACRDECRLSGRSWYGEIWHRRKLTEPSGTFRPDQRPRHCFAMVPNPPLDIQRPTETRSLPKSTQPPATRRVEASLIRSNASETIRLIEWH